MPLDRFLISPINEGQVNNVLPWLIGDRAFDTLRNCYTWRERIKKRFGSIWINQTDDQKKSRLRLNIGEIEVTAGVGTITVTVPGTKWKIGQQFSVLDTMLTVNVANGNLLTTNAFITGTYNTTDGELTINTTVDSGVPDETPVYFYPLDPGMGSYVYESAAGALGTSIEFDTQFAYFYSLTTTAFERLGSVTWTGDDDEFFWGMTWRNSNTLSSSDNVDLFFATNYKDKVRYWSGTTWVDYEPLLYGSVRLQSAKLIFSFKGMLLFINTKENNQTFGNRCRVSWTQSIIGNVVTPQGATIAAVDNAFFEDSGKGSYIDAPTSEEAISGYFINDRLVIDFEESTYQLVYTGSPNMPVVWKKIDSNYGATSTLGKVSINNAIVGFGKNAIVSCNGAQVQRIDDKIPNAVFEIPGDVSNFQRVCGIRDFKEENVYWTYPRNRSISPFPAQVLVYDYVHGMWSINDDSFTVFGYHYDQSGLVWDTWHTPWRENTGSWDDGEDIVSYKQTIAINQQGFVVEIDHDKSVNAPALSITDIVDNTLVIINHNLEADDFIKITGCTGMTELNDRIFKVIDVIDLNTIKLDETFPTGYTGMGVAARRSRVEIRTKEYNFYTKTGQDSYVPFVEFYVKNTGPGEPNLVDVDSPEYDPDLNKPRMRVDYFLSSSQTSMIAAGNATGASSGVSKGNILDMFPYTLYPQEKDMLRFWKRVYFQAQGQTIQFKIFYDDEMMLNPNQCEVGFELNAMIIYARPIGSRYNT